MLIEIINTNIVNKGAHLMHYAIVDRVRSQLPEADLCRRPHRILMPYRECARHGMLLKLPSQVRKLNIDFLLRLIPASIRSSYGLVGGWEVDIVLDASGFAYSDEWGLRPLETMLARVRRWRKRGTKVFLLPQALGPFSSTKSQSQFRQIVDCCEQVYPRDEISYRHALVAGADAQKMRIVPDITIDFHPQGSSKEVPVGTVFIIPNARMIDKYAVRSVDEYVNALHAIGQHIVAKGFLCNFLVHETSGDETIAKKVLQKGNLKASIVSEDSPLNLKLLLGRAHLVIGSRFHGLVSALSQGVPVIAMGWSHKYEQLLKSFGQEKFSVRADGFRLDLCEALVDEVLGGPGRQRAVSKIVRAVAEQRKRISDMWADISNRSRYSAVLPSSAGPIRTAFSCPGYQSDQLPSIDSRAS